MLFTPLSALVAYYLIRKSQSRFVVFVLCLWFFSPFIRRIADLHAGFRDPSPILLAPILASGIVVVRLVQRRDVFFSRGFLPYSLTLMALCYGLSIGILQLPLQAAVTDFLRWTVPVVFASYVFTLGDEQQAVAAACEQAFLYVLIIMSVYGIWQSFSPPPWDTYWLSNVDAGSFGTADASSVRVFSTMNSPGPFAAAVGSSVLLLMASRRRLARLAQLLGIAVLILTQVRSAWIGMAVGLAYIFLRAGAKARVRMIGFAAIGVVILGFALTLSGSTDQLTSRFSSFSDLKQDESFSERLSGSQAALAHAFHDPLGGGMGYLDSAFLTNADFGSSALGAHDNGFFEFLVTLGFPGCLLYGAAVVLLLRRGTSRRGQPDPVRTAYFAVCLGILAQLPTGNSLFGVGGLVFWLAGTLLLMQAEESVKPALTA
jgi:hypothetical protein